MNAPKLNALKRDEQSSRCLSSEVVDLFYKLSLCYNFCLKNLVLGFR